MKGKSSKLTAQSVEFVLDVAHALVCFGIWVTEAGLHWQPVGHCGSHPFKFRGDIGVSRKSVGIENSYVRCCSLNEVEQP